MNRNCIQTILVMACFILQGCQHITNMNKQAQFEPIKQVCLSSSIVHSRRYWVDPKLKGAKALNQVWFKAPI